MGSFNKIRDTLETGATLGGNYLLPGSSLLTGRLVRKGSQAQLNTPLGRIANIGSGLAGAGVGSSFTGLPSASSVGAGWTNAADKLGNLAGAGNIGTEAGTYLGGLADKVGTGISDAASSFGSATGLSNLVGSGGESASPGFFSGLFGGGSPALDSASVDMQAPSAIGASAIKSGIGPSFASGGLSAALSGGTGGGSSSFLPLASAAFGGINSLNANDKAQKDLLSAEHNSINTLQPFLASGAAANNRLSDLLGTGTNTGADGFGSLTKQFNPQDLQNEPGYKFQLEQGNQALDRKAAAGGGYFSGAALKAAQDYGQGLADTTYADAFNRDQATKGQQYGMFSGQSGAGQNAANSAGNIYENIGNAKANSNISSSNILNQTLSSLLSGSGAKRLVGYGQNGQPLYA